MSRIIEIVYADGSVGTMTIVKRQKKVKKTYRLCDDVWEHVKDYLGCKIQVDWDKLKYVKYSYEYYSCIKRSLWYGVDDDILTKMTWTSYKIYLANNFIIDDKYLRTFLRNKKSFFMCVSKDQLRILQD